MGRCIWCHSVVSKDEDYCYVCGDNVPSHAVPNNTRKMVKRRPVSALTNAAFLVSLAVTAYYFFAEHKLSLPVALTISSALLLIRIVAEGLAGKNSN
jgi:hypothetical protein